MDIQSNPKNPNPYPVQLDISIGYPITDCPLRTLNSMSYLNIAGKDMHAMILTCPEFRVSATNESGSNRWLVLVWPGGG